MKVVRNQQNLSEFSAKPHLENSFAKCSLYYVDNNIESNKTPSNSCFDNLEVIDNQMATSTDFQGETLGHFLIAVEGITP